MKQKDSSMKNNNMAKETVQWIFTILGAVVLSLFCRTYAFAITEVNQSSMQNTLIEGQRVFEYKLGYYFSKPQKGDIVIFKTDKVKVEEKGLKKEFGDSNETFLIKRVIGVEGDTIDIKNGSVYVNGVKLNEPYIKGATYTDPEGIAFPITVTKDKYFVMGDNREVSLDGRSFGLIGADQIDGKAVFRIWPFNELGKLK